MMKNGLGDCFNLIKGDVVSVVGAGGKTSLILYLADYLSGKSVVSASTKMFVPNKEWDLYLNEPILWGSKDEVIIAGKEIVSNKLSDINPYTIKSGYDYWFIEADGSKERPLKGWGPDEPVIIPETTMTIGVLDMTTLGMTINQDTVFRLEAFSKMTCVEETVSQTNLVDVVVNEEGLFKNSKGRLVLFINKVESDILKNQAKRLWTKIQADPRCPDFDRCIVGSVLQASGEMEGSIWTI